MSDGDIERLTRMLEEKDFEIGVLRRSFELFAEREKEMRYCLKWFTSRDFDRFVSYEEAIERAKKVLG